MNLVLNKLVVYDADQWGSACPVLRVAGPARAAGLEVVSGNTWSEGVLRSYTTDVVQSAQLVIIQRDFPRFQEAYTAVVAAARAEHKPVIYELDDLLLEVPESHPSRSYYAEARLPILAALAEADGVTTSTRAMAEYLSAFNPRTSVLPNYLNDQIWPLRPPRTVAADSPVVIGYVGGRTHAADLAPIGPVLSRLARRYGNRIRLRFWGVTPPADVADAGLPNVEWTRLSILDYERYAAYLQQQSFDICLAPLVDTPFNRCKSPIKYLEYSALGIAGVYSRLEPYNLIVRDGLNGLLAAGEAEWEAALVELIERPDRRLQLAEQAQATIRADWLLTQHATEWPEAYQALRLQEPGAPAATSQANVARKALEWQRGLVAQTQAQESVIQVQQSQLLRMQAERDQYAAQAARLVAITSSPSWGLLQKLIATRYRVIPKGSRGERVLDMLVLAFRYWRQAGTLATVRRAVEVLGALLPGLGRSLGALLPGSRDPYQAWIKIHEPGAGALKRQRQNPDQAAWPRISVITPVYNPPARALADTLASVRAQTYANWEFCLVDGNSDAPGVREVLETAAHGDERVKLKRLDQNLGISGNQNEALALATGEYVLVLDHDDLLAPDALFAIAELLSRRPDLDVVYFDEDKISEDGRLRRDPWFKPSAWSPDLMLSTNVLMHCVVRRRLLQEVGGYDSRMDGAQDWDLALRLGERTRSIAHIPRVYYHWRQLPGSAARDANAKPWALAAQAGAIEAHLHRLGVLAARVSFPSLGRVRVHWPTSGARVSIIIPTRDKLELLRPCLDSIFRQTDYPDYEIVLVDTGSIQPGTWKYYGELTAQSVPVTVVHFTGEFNYSAANNLGASRASGDLLLFLNNDIEVLHNDWLDELAGWAERPEVGVVGCKLLRPDGTIQHAGLVIGLAGHGSHAFDGSREDTYGPFGSSEWYRDYQAVTGACLMTRRDVFAALSGFDEAYQIGYGDIEFCLRAGSHGCRVIYTPFARLLHHEGGSRGFYIPAPDVLRAYQQMVALVEAGDPFFSPNLSNAQRQPSIAASSERPRVECLEKILADFDLVAGMSRIKPAAPASPTRTFLAAGSSVPIERRILLLSHELSRSGAPMLLANLARHLLQAGYWPAVLSPIDGPLRQDYAQADIEVIVDPAALVDARVVANRLSGFGLMLANTILTWRGVCAARARQVPCLWWIQEADFGRALVQRTPALARAFGAADLVMFPTAANARLYAPYLDPERQVIVPAVPAWPPADLNTRVVKRPAGKFVLVTMASHEPRKGQDVLLSAFSALSPEQRTRIELYSMGQILDRRYYRRLVQKAGQYSGVHIMGAVPHAEALAYLAAADIFVLPSRDDVLPVALLEAMALGKPIIATAVGGIPEAVEHGTHAWLVPPDDPPALAHALDRLFRDSELREKLGNAALARFEADFTFDKFGVAVEDLLRQLVEARQLRQLNSPIGRREALGDPQITYQPPTSLAARVQ